jgi:leucyl/phenylalanyl-tRNA--protein transferase
VSTTKPPAPVGPSRWMLPDPRRADEDGIVGVGADLEPATLVEAYRHGVFPWPHDDMPLPWFSPDPRALIDVHAIHVSRSLARRMRGCGWTTTVDTAFQEVMHGCATDRDTGTWITNSMREAFVRLHALGWAHSVEVWDGDQLVGGLYGVQLGGVFTGESMFHQATDASKVALVELCERMAVAGGAWLDAQIETEHLRSMGAQLLSRRAYLKLLAKHRDAPVLLATDRQPVARLARRRPSAP